MLGGDGWDSTQLWDLGGDALNGDYISNHYSVDDPSPANTKFVAAYQSSLWQCAGRAGGPGDTTPCKWWPIHQTRRNNRRTKTSGTLLGNEKL